MRQVAIFAISCATIVAMAIYYDNRQQIAVVVAAAAQIIATAIAAAMIVLALLALCVGIAVVRTHLQRTRLPVRGVFPLREYHLLPWWRRVLNWLRGRPNPRLLYNPNHDIGLAIIIHDNIYQVAPAAGWHLQESFARAAQATLHLNALAADALARGQPPVANASTAKLLAGYYHRPGRVPVAEEAPGQLSAQPLLSLEEALAQSEQQAWLVGQDPDSGALATYNPALHAHAAVVGATGTGKTTGAAFAIALQALMHGWHVIILDPDGGADWRDFAPVAEWHETDYGVFPDQVRELYRFYEQRRRLLMESGAVNLASLDGQAPTRVLVIIEEYGGLIQQVRMAHGRAAGQVDDMLDIILRGGRKLSLSLLLVDQYPEHWSQQVLAAVKWRAIYQLGPGQGARLEEYHAARLPARGVFLHRGRRYRSWHVRPELPRLLAACSAPNAGVRLLGSAERTAVPEVDGDSPNEFGTERTANDAYSPPPPPPNEPGREAPKRELIRWWIEHIGGSQADFRDWCRARGIHVARGYVSEVFNERGESK
jgi:hypothetical protein